MTLNTADADVCAYVDRCILIGMNAGYLISFPSCSHFLFLFSSLLFSSLPYHYLFSTSILLIRFLPHHHDRIHRQQHTTSHVYYTKMPWRTTTTPSTHPDPPPGPLDPPNRIPTTLSQLAIKKHLGTPRLPPIGFERQFQRKSYLRDGKGDMSLEVGVLKYQQGPGIGESWSVFFLLGQLHP
jgi:hypothetical protein